jgi:hypothetical protein
VQISSSARSYRASLYPTDIELDEVEFQAAKRLLPTIQLKAANADEAMAKAHLVSGKRVFSVERIEGAT